MNEYINHFSSKVTAAIKDLPKEEISKALNILQATYERDGRIYIFGNGGSLALATHWVSDFNKTVFGHGGESEHIKKFQAIRLPSTESELTAWANDVGYDMVFAGPLKNYLQDPDTIIAISSSGNSTNIIRAVELAKSHKIPVIGLSGFDGGKLNQLADAKILVKTQKGEYGVIESVHGAILHLVTQYFKDYFDHLTKIDLARRPTTILVTGNRGYIGSVLVEELINRGYDVIGYDIGYYNDCALYESDPALRKQISKDVRDAAREDFDGVDAVIHLAALSNDPLGELRPGLTEKINLQGALKIADLARAAGAKRFIYASSQSMYGVADTGYELTEEEAGPHGVTAYARTKWDAEVELKRMSSPNFAVVCFRPSTVFGASPMLRSDIVFNNLVGCAYTTGKIEIKSDGTPWRPVVHVKDVSRAFIAGLEAPLDLVKGESFNVGIPNGNFTVRDLAEAAQRSVPSSTLIFTGEHGKDSRTYKVSFHKILTQLKDYYKPEWDLDKGGKELVELYEKVGFNEDMFRGKRTNRLKQVNYLLENNQLDENLRWRK